MKQSMSGRHLMYSIIAVHALYLPPLYSMDQTYEGYIKDNNTIVFELVFENGSIFNHNLVCSLALVNKYINQFIKNTAHIRKQQLEMGYDNHKNKSRLVWHVHGSAYAYVYFVPEPMRLLINYNYLSAKNFMTCITQQWNNDPHPLLAESNVFFNQNGDACYYASGIINVLGRGKKREIIEYSLSRKGQERRIRCVLGRINDKKEFQSLSLAHFAKNSFPDLTKAILNSQITYELSSPWHTNKIKVFHWDGVKLPQRYVLNGHILHNF